jgi:NAD(P)-dependent dehydrogenase (short-subunit alcohol dehydrogenase family)
MNDNRFLRNRPTIAVVTGGTQGLGLAIAKRLAFEGAQGIVISGRNAEKGEDAAAGVRALGTDCIFVKADVSNADDCYKLIDTAIAHFGTVNGLVNSAGIADRGTLLDTTVELWERHFNTNARGPFLTMQRVLRHLVDTEKPGSIVNIISMVAHIAGSRT